MVAAAFMGMHGALQANSCCVAGDSQDADNSATF